MSDPLRAPASALLRGVSAALPRCLRSNDLPIDLDLARAQHAAYAEVLRRQGVAVALLPADDQAPDCCYIEDTAFILGDAALITCPGAPSRRREVPPVAAALAARLPTAEMSLPATLDGGDVMRAGERLFVGLSARTNREGLIALAELASAVGLEVVPLPVDAGLHLKSAVTMADAETAVAVRGALDLAPLRAAGLEVLEVDEPMGGNVLNLGDAVLVSAAAPRTGERLAARGLTVLAVDVSELHKGDGALTCLSLRFPAPGAWCA